MARPIQYDRRVVLEKAMHLFWRKGYEATALEEILQTTGFNRHSLYKEFGGKDGLYMEALRAYDETWQACIEAPLLVEEDGLAAIENMFDQRRKPDVEGKGCLMTNTLNERECVPKEACDYAGDFTDRLREGLRHAIAAAQQHGDIPAHKDPDALATYVLYVMQGLGTMSKKGITAGEVQTVKEQTLAFLRS